MRSLERLVRISYAPRLSPNLCVWLEEGAHNILREELGNGEHSARHNNSGPDIWRYRRGDATGGGVKTGGAWCASLRSYVYVVRAARHGPPLVLPFETSRGAQRVAKNIAAAGRWIVAPGERLPSLEWLAEHVPMGATIAWKRAGWRGHVESWDHVDLTAGCVITIGGNRDNRGSGGERYAVVDYHLRTHAEVARRLLGIATLQR